MTEYYESFGSEEGDHEFSSDLLSYDHDERRWKCACPDWKADGRCRHVRFFQRQDTLTVNERYL